MCILFVVPINTGHSNSESIVRSSSDTQDLEFHNGPSKLVSLTHSTPLSTGWKLESWDVKNSRKNDRGETSNKIFRALATPWGSAEVSNHRCQFKINHAKF